jgi:ketosteroid isomerase-like protein
MEESLRHRIVQSVERRIRSFEAAERALDAEKLIGHFSSGPEFYMHNDGQRLTYDAIAAAVRGAFPTLRSIEGGFEDLDLMVLSPDAVLATAKFREIVTDLDGNQAGQHGAASWLWRQIEGEWRIVYGHVDHYPDPSK